MSGACSPPSPSSPWQSAQRASKTPFPLKPGFKPVVDFLPFEFWPRAVPTAPKNIRTNSTLRTIRQFTSWFSCSCSPQTPSRRKSATATLIYHRIRLTQIKIFRFIGFCFVLARFDKLCASPNPTGRGNVSWHRGRGGKRDALLPRPGRWCTVQVTSVNQAADMRAAFISIDKGFVTCPEGMTRGSRNAEPGDPGACRRR